jgi:carbonic anhydrase
MSLTQRQLFSGLGLIAAGGVTIVSQAIVGKPESHTAHATAEEMWQVQGQAAKNDQMVRLGVEANVRHSTQELLRGSASPRQEVTNGKLAVCKAVYWLHSGEVVRLG